MSKKEEIEGVLRKKPIECKYQIKMQKYTLNTKKSTSTEKNQKTNDNKDFKKKRHRKQKINCYLHNKFILSFHDFSKKSKITTFNNNKHR